MNKRTYPKITKDTISEIAHKIIEVLCRENLAGDMSIYYNNKRIYIKQKFDDKFNPIWVKEETEDVDPHNYFEYAAHNHIISISTEGLLYDRLNHGSGNFPKELEELFDSYGIYYELGNSWNLSFFPVDEEENRIEYTIYQKPKKPVFIRYPNECPKEFLDIMKRWYNLSLKTGDIGGCVIGAKMCFQYNGEEYNMAPPSPWQGECSWTPHVDFIKKELEKIGATNIRWDGGRLD